MSVRKGKTYKIIPLSKRNTRVWLILREILQSAFLRYMQRSATYQDDPQKDKSASQRRGECFVGFVPAMEEYPLVHN